MTTNTSNEPNTLDELMSKDPLELTNADLDKIIAYQRKQRAMAESGQKVAKVKPARSGESLLDSLGIKKPVVDLGKRRF